VSARLTKSIRNVFLCVFLVAAGILIASAMGYAGGGEDDVYSINIDVSPNIINLESERWGDVRIYTSLRYSLYATSGHNIFVYFNGSVSVENIRPTRDSLGNLILRFSLEDLLDLDGWLKPHASNDVMVVVSMDNGDEYIGYGEAYLTIKR
jgi:hypothetical protein